MNPNTASDITASLDIVLEKLEGRNCMVIQDDTISTDDISAITECNVSLNQDKYNKKDKLVDSEEEISPWSVSYFGVPLNYFCVGMMLGGSTSILYPILIVHKGVSSSLYTASISIVTIFWSYKIVFGTLSDCFPIFGYKRKSYMTLGWILCAVILSKLASMGNEIDSTSIVWILTLANLGYVMADVAADGFVVWIAHREPTEKRGRMQTLVYATNSFGQIVINLIILFGFSGPSVNCPGYQHDESMPCTDDSNIISRSQYGEEFPNTWYVERCFSDIKDLLKFHFNLSNTGVSKLL